MIRRPPRSTLMRSSAASDVYKRQTWDRLRAQNDRSKLIMLGTPNRGSAATVLSLIGADPIIRLLKRLDRGRSGSALLNDIAAMPGVLELLPTCQSGRFFDPYYWMRLCRVGVPGWTGPHGTALADAKEASNSLKLRASDAKHMIYIAAVSYTHLTLPTIA